MSQEAWPHSPTMICRHISFDGGLSVRSQNQRPDRYAFFRKASAVKGAIARGAGLSYASASFGNDAVSIEMSAFDRVLGFDSSTGIVEVEAGIVLGDLFGFLAPRNRYLPVQPGHGAISVGGCIAADVHGKNQARDGTFISQVESLRLFHPSHGIIEVSDSREHDLFRATCGGYGTSGIILSARLRTSPLPSQRVTVRHIRVDTVADAAESLGLLLRENDFAYSWHDMAQRGEGFGRGYIAAGKFAPAVPGLSLSDTMDIPRISASWRARMPFNAFTPMLSRLINFAHLVRQRRRRDADETSVAQSLFPIHGSESYFRLFGARGFHEYQAIIPFARFTEYLRGLQERAQKHKITIALASAKIFAGNRDLLRFSGEGICFAINIPRNIRSLNFLDDVDRLLIAIKGHPNIIKDSRLPRVVLEATYPEVDKFRSIIRHWDSARIFKSELSCRLGL